MTIMRAATIEAREKRAVMRLSSVDMPLPLLEALRSGRLVIFAGAGVSRSHPSNLPDFEKLTEEISDGALERRDKEPFDIFLGRLSQAGIPVHERAARILDRTDSHPSELHRLLVGLFPSPESLCIVTTNFDRHFERVIEERWPGERIEVYAAPALPVGSRFSGLGYVHGQLAKDVHRLVLTDSDFGKAYLTEGWARRFLSDLFGAYDVLFVGYSHEDTVLRYLARGLPPASERMRFALTPSGDPERWRFLGITPVEYDPADDHAALREGLKAWLDLEGRGPLSHERGIKELVGRSPQVLTEQEDDYLLFCLRDPRLAQFFYRHAHDSSWLNWAGKHSILLPLLDPNEHSADSAAAAEWLTLGPLSERGDVARQLIYKERRISPQLWNAIAHSVWRALDNVNVPREAAERAAQWLSILEQNDAGAFAREIISYWLHHLSAKEHTFLAVQLLAYLTRPIVLPNLGIRKRDGDGDEWEEVFRPHVKIRGEHYWLSREWERLFKPNLQLFAQHLASMIFSHLHQAHLLLRSQGIGSEDLDPLSYKRSAIEPHEQNQQGAHDSFDTLIDAGRDVMDWLIQHKPSTAQHHIEAWLPVEAPLVRRLCIYALAEHPQVAANYKVKHVISSRWLEQWQLKHEVFFLLRKTYKESSPPVRRRLLRAAERFYLRRNRKRNDDPSKNAQSKAYEFFVFLTWLEESDSACQLVQERLVELRKKFPEFAMREYPDFGHWSHGVRSISYVSPLPKEEILKLSPAEWVKMLDEIRAEVRSIILFDDRVGGFLTETEKAGAEDFDWTLGLAEFLVTQGKWEHVAWRYICRCWANQPHSESTWNRLLAFLGGHHELFRYAADIFDLLLRRIENRDIPATEDMIVQAIALADRLWPTLPEEKEVEDANKWVQASIYTPGGKLGLFVVHALSRFREIREEEWSGIPKVFQSLLDQMTQVKGTSPYGRVMLCGKLHFMFAVDPSWTRRKLFPLFDWSINRRVAQEAWHGLLAWGYLTRELIPEFMPLIEQTFDYLGELGNLRRRFPGYLASIAYSFPENPLEAEWIKRFHRKAQPTDLKEWAQAIGSFLSEAEPEERRRLWEAWLRDYFVFRLESGIHIGDDEWYAVMKWSLYLEDFLPDVVTLLGRRPAVRGSRDIIYYQLRDREGLLKYPDAFAELLLYLLRAEERLYHDCQYLGEIFHQLLERGASQKKLLQFVDRLAELGCSNAQELAALIGYDS